jgi:hypothetical protein
VNEARCASRCRKREDKHGAKERENEMRYAVLGRPM